MALVDTFFVATGVIGAVGWMWFVYSARDVSMLVEKMTRIIRALLVASMMSIAIYVLVSAHLVEEDEAVMLAVALGCAVAIFVYNLPAIAGSLAACAVLYLALEYTDNSVLASLVAAGTAIVVYFMLDCIGRHELVVLVWQSVISTTLVVVNSVAVHKNHSAWSPTKEHWSVIAFPWTALLIVRLLVQFALNRAKGIGYDQIESS